MASITREFRKFHLNQSEILGLQCMPLWKLVLTGTKFSTTSKSGLSRFVFELQFNKIEDFRIIMRSTQCHILACDVFSKSEFLNSFKQREIVRDHKLDKRKLHHFLVDLDVGKIDVIAENYCFNILYEDAFSEQ